MKALLLAAGLGTRLLPLTEGIPKCLVPIHGRPLLDCWLSLLAGAGIGPILVNLHHHADRVREHLSTSPHRSSVVTVHESQLLGTGGTLLANRTFFEDAPFLFIHGDNLSRFDVHAFIRRHTERPPGCEITMMTFRTDTPEQCGIVELDAAGIVRGFHEKVPDPPGNLASGAVFILEPSILSHLRGLGKETIDFSAEVLPAFVGRICTFHNADFHRDIGTMESYRKALATYRHVEDSPHG